MAGILSDEEKAYCRGMEALRRNDFAEADKNFRACAGLHQASRGFQIITQAAAILALLQSRKMKQTITIDGEIKGIIDNGQETIVCGEGEEESAR